MTSTEESFDKAILAPLPVDTDNVPLGVINLASAKVKRSSKHRVRSYQPQGYIPPNPSKKAERNNRNSLQEIKRGSYQPKGYTPPVSIGKKRKSENFHPKSKGTSFDTIRSEGERSDISDAGHSDMSSDTIFNVTVIDYHKKAKTTIEQADNPSYFISPEVLVTLKGIWLLVSIAVLIVGIYLQGKFYFNTIEGWHFVGLIIYFIITFFEVGRFISGSGVVLPKEQEIIDALFLTTTSLAMILPIYYWIFEAKLSLSYFKNDFSYLKIYQIIANHVSLIFLGPEIIYTRVLIEKMFAIIPAAIVILYHGQVWVTYYVFGWDWPVPFYFANYFTMNINPIYLFLALATWIAAISFGVILTYLLVDLREKTHKKQAKSYDKKKRQSVNLEI